MSTQLEDVRRPQAYEPCEECGAPMDPQQRYCVNCAARRGNGANPSSRYFAMVSKRSRRPLVPPAEAKGAQTSRAAAVGFFALLPIAVALGVMVGHSGSGSGDSDALLQALRERQATAAGTTGAATTGAAAAAPKVKKEAAAAAKSKAKPKEKVVAHTANGDVHEVTDFHASEQKESEDTKLVEENPEQTGENYIKAQQNLPDVIVVGGEGGGSTGAPAGVEP
jgi:hypothetical protein